MLRKATLASGLSPQAQAIPSLTQAAATSSLGSVPQSPEKLL